MYSREDNHRPRHIEGYCENIAAGEVKVGINNGKCSGGGAVVDAYIGWRAVSRIMITEVPAAQC